MGEFFEYMEWAKWIGKAIHRGAAGADRFENAALPVIKSMPALTARANVYRGGSPKRNRFAVPISAGYFRSVLKQFGYLWIKQ